MTAVDSVTRPANAADQSVAARVPFRPLALIGAAVALLSTHADPDLWGHLRFGLDVLASHRLATALERYSFTADRHPFIYHEWLSEAVMAVAYRLGGAPGLQVLKGLLAAAVLWGIWTAVRRAPYAGRWGGLALAAWGALPLFLTVRPQLWSALGLVIVCRALTASSPRALRILPFIFALWANLHGGWIVGGAVLAVWTAVAWVTGSQARRSLLVVGVLSLAATLLNPYGVDLWRFVIETVRFGRDNISEWQPIWRVGTDAIALWLITAGAIVWSVRRHGLPSPSAVAVLLFLGVAAARVDRLGPLFTLAAVTLLARDWATQPSALPVDRSPRVLIDGAAVMAAMIAAYSSSAVPRCVAIDTAQPPDVRAAESLRGAHGKLVTFFDWGEYAIWHFGPALQVSIDGRRETVYREATLDAQLGIAEGTPQGLEALARLRPEYVWLPVWSGSTLAWLVSHSYRVDVRTPRSFVAARADMPPLRPWEGQPSGCFPGS